MQQLVVVRRDKFAAFTLLARAFEDRPGVRLVWDRRRGDRRNAGASSDPTDRRRRERRRNPSTTWGSGDYLVVNVIDRVTSTAQTAAPPLNDGSVHARDLEEIRRDIDVAAASSSNVLISGGSAQSRKSVAHQLHRSGDRRDRPFIVLDRATFFDVSVFSGTRSDDRARVEGTEAGTILIEEVAELSSEQQSQLFVELERRAVRPPACGANESRDARILSETGYELLERLASKQFRADLFYRLNVIHLALPSDFGSTVDRP